METAILVGERYAGAIGRAVDPTVREKGIVADQDDMTVERSILDRDPELRASVVNSTNFQDWKDSLPAVVIDGVRYYVRGGDMLKDDDQVIVEWARRSGLLRGEPDGDGEAEQSER